MNYKSILMFSVVVSGAALAKDPAAMRPQPVAFPDASSRAAISEPRLACPAGTKQAGGQSSTKEASFCARLDASGRSVIHGPYLSLHPNGGPAVEGQYADGLRTGTWRSYDAAGAKVEEVTFALDTYSGVRTQWIAGKKSIEETYLAGRRQGEQRTWDASGNVTVVRFVDDQPTTK
jgi:hypothetical protein